MIGCMDSSVRFTGRWMLTDKQAIATAPGSFFELAFKGLEVELHFNTEWMTAPHPHLWVSLDHGPRFEIPIDSHICIQAKTVGNHVVEVIFKSAVEMTHRWYQPLDGRVSFLGYDADHPGELPADNRKTIEFIGDSITEGVMIDDPTGEGIDWLHRPYQDNSTATYAWLAAEYLGLKPIIMGYGGVGVTKEGCGCVPRAQDAYLFCYHNAPINYADSDFIVINHGTNDIGKDPAVFKSGYWTLLDTVAKHNPRSRIMLVPPFCGAWHEEIRSIAQEYAETAGREIDFISSAGWAASKRIHPDREGHILLAKNLAREIVKRYTDI